ncbi:MAG: TRAP transporter substrate-binding protein DctP, partial [Ketobacteraceae bacterium]|nr:TRAP transporter substrate-binding protein DctP [Ketobacteraceae bacterium]
TESHGFELLKTFQVPYVAPDNPYLTFRIINELLAEGLKSEFYDRGVYPGHVVPVRPLNLMSKTPIRHPEDLKGKKVVSFINAPGAAESLGFAQVNMPFTEIYTALQQGLVDAVIWSDLGFLPFKIYEQASYYTPLGVAPLTIETCINPRAFKRLPHAYQQLFHDFQQRVGIALVHASEEFSKQAAVALKDHDVSILQLTEVERDQWRRAFQPVAKQWFDHCEKQGKSCRELVESIARLTDKYQGFTNEQLIRLSLEQPVQGIINF